MKDVIQIAGVVDSEDARVIADCGVDWVGFPFGLTVHEEDLPRETAAGIIRALPVSQSAVLITYLNNADEILSLARYMSVTRVQLHGEIAIEELSRLREAAKELFVIKSIIVGKGPLSRLEELVSRFEPHVDMFITDTYDPTTGATGATGATHDWSQSRVLARSSRRPVMLAGGLNPGNVARAIRVVMPAAVDAHTGVEDKAGRKSPGLLREFVSEARAAFAEFREGADAG